MKKILVASLVMVFVLSFATMAFAQPRWNRSDDRGAFCVSGERGARGHHFWDAEGNLLSRAEVEANLDAMVISGTITALERDFLLERYDFCAVYGFGGGFGCGRGGFMQGGFRQGGGRGFGNSRWR